MAAIKYFSDLNGAAVELAHVHGLTNKLFAERFPGLKGRRYDGFAMMVGSVQGSREELPVTRAIEYKSNPSKHVCDARCLHATGKIMRCECSCGGKNHGMGG